MDTPKIWRTGDAIAIQCGYRSIPGSVILASENGASLMLSFEAILDGHAGMMPVLRDDDGLYHSVVTGNLVEFTEPKT